MSAWERSFRVYGVGMRHNAINSGAQRRIRAKLRVCSFVPFLHRIPPPFLPAEFVILGLDFY
jgi:hypothetical protein